MSNLLDATRSLAAAAPPLPAHRPRRHLAATAATVLGRAMATAALQVLILLLGTAAVVVALLGAFWLSG